MNSAKAALDLIPFFAEVIKRIFEAVAGLGTTHDARSLEAYVMAQCKALGAVIEGHASRARDIRNPSPPTPLPLNSGGKGRTNSTVPQIPLPFSVLSVLSVLCVICVEKAVHFVSRN